MVTSTRLSLRATAIVDLAGKKGRGDAAALKPTKVNVDDGGNYRRFTKESHENVSEATLFSCFEQTDAWTKSDSKNG